MMSRRSVKPKRRAGTSTWLRAGIVLGTLVALVVLERHRPLRRRAESPRRRNLRNLAVAAVGAAALRIAEKPIVEPLAAAVERRRWGLLKQIDLPRWVEVVLSIVLMDYTLYIWHVLTHRAPFLWRFHVVHHIDLDLSATTAVRFHFAELLLSVPWRAGQVLLLGISPRALSIWQTCALLSILFHHSNLRLPIGLERRLVHFIVTPRMHGIHHSAVPEETDANWSSGLTIWDWLHGTLRLNVSQDAIIIGIPAYRAAADVALPALLSLPFTEQRPAWQWAEDDRSTKLAGETLVH